MKHSLEVYLRWFHIWQVLGENPWKKPRAAKKEGKDFLTARKYWNKLKQRLKEEGNETVTNCHQLKSYAVQSLTQ